MKEAKIKFWNDTDRLTHTPWYIKFLLWFKRPMAAVEKDSLNVPDIFNEKIGYVIYKTLFGKVYIIKYENC